MDKIELKVKKHDEFQLKMKITCPIRKNESMSSKRSENFFNFMRYLDNIPTYQRYSDLRGKVCLFHLGITVHKGAVCFK